MQLENTEDFYPLSPLQEGLLFHALYSPEGGEYISQISCVMRGELNVDALKEAWRQVVQRHAALRTFFLWEGLRKPVQVVQKHLDLTWEEFDWRGAQREQLTAYLAHEQTRSFQLSRAPLMRLALIRLSDDEYEFVWSHHHLLLDGWSTSLVTNEVIRFYRALSRGEHLLLPNPRPYRDYIAWLQQQDLSSAENYWRQTLKGFTTPTPLIPNEESTGKGDYIVRQLKLTTSATALLQEEARQQGLTLNTLVQGAWALLLSYYTGHKDVVFGATVSGRPPQLQGIEEMVGIFINTLPVRVKIAPEMRVVDWLRHLQAEQLETRQYEYSPLSRIQNWSEVQRGSLLFQSIVVFENYPEQSSSSTSGAQARVGAWDIRHFIKESYPMTLMAAPGAQLRMEIKYDNSLFDATTIGHMSEHLEMLLHNVLSQSNVWEQTLGEVLARTHAEQQVNEKRKVKQVRVEMLKNVKRKTVSSC
jgi:surfactin family lipopeptide synthetase C